MIDQPYKDALLLEVRNVHSEDCGVPTALTKDSTNAEYVGYFENQHGEQWVVEINRDAKTGVLRGGDLGWEPEVVIANDTFDDLILALEEFLWLSACWRAATGGELKIAET